MTEENKQLQLFESQLSEVPKTRALALRKAAREKGLEFAQTKGLSIVENKHMAEEAKNSIERIGSSQPLNVFIMGCHRQLNGAIGIKNAKDPNITTAHLAAKTLGAFAFAKVFRTAETSKTRSEGRQAACEGLRKMMELVA